MVNIRLGKPIYSIEDFNKTYPMGAFTKSEADAVYNYLVKTSQNRQVRIGEPHKKKSHKDSHTQEDDEDEPNAGEDERELIRIQRMYRAGNLDIARLRVGDT